MEKKEQIAFLEGFQEFKYSTMERVLVAWEIYGPTYENCYWRIKST
jgi:hypothetical protein